MKKKILFCSRLFFIVLFMVKVIPSFANANFIISPTPAFPRPTEVRQGSIVSTFYTVTNQTNSPRIGYSVQGAPATVTQNTSNPTYCQNPISLAARASCILQLDISGKAVSNFALCRGSSCTTSAEPLNVSFNSSSLPSITLEEIPVNSQLLALREPVIAEYEGNWLIVSGTTGNFHQFQNNYFISSIYVYNPTTMQLNAKVVNALTVPDDAVRNQLKSSNVQFLQDGDTLYIIGGFYTANNVNWETLQTITAINIPGMINAVLNDTDLTPFIHSNTTVPEFKVTGGQLGKIGNDFYLSFGMNCFGNNYCGGVGGGQVYTNTIYKFSTNTTVSTVSILGTNSRPDSDNSGFRRRDYTLIPMMLENTETLFAEGGPFTPGIPAFVWTNGILFDGNLVANNSFINQQANQYLSPALSMYSASKNESYAVTFSGLSNLFWTTTGLAYDRTTLYGNILDLISYNGSGSVQEYANIQPICGGQPLASCLYTGLSAIFIPVADANLFNNRNILQLDSIPEHSKKLVGYIYAGMNSYDQKIFPPAPTPSPTFTTNKVYAVYVTSSGTGTPMWNNITNLYPGTPYNP